MPSTESMSETLEAAVFSLKESLPSDLAPKVDEATQKLDANREEDRQINEALHILRELRGEILARAGAFAHFLLDELGKNPKVSKEEMQQKVKDDPKLTRQQRTFFGKAVEVADEDRKARATVLQNLKDRARQYLEDIYGKGNIPFTQTEVDAGDPRVLGAIIFAKRSKAPPKGEVILIDHPLAVVVSVENPADVNKIYNPGTDVAKGGQSGNEEKQKVGGFYSRIFMGDLPHAPLIMAATGGNFKDKLDHEFGHYLHDIYRQIAGTRNKVPGVQNSSDFTETYLKIYENRATKNPADLGEVYAYKQTLADFNAHTWQRARDELVADYQSKGEIRTRATWLMQKADLGGKENDYSLYDYYHRQFSPRVAKIPEAAQRELLAAREEYYDVLDEQAGAAVKAIDVIDYFRMGVMEENKMLSLMNQYRLPQWKARINEVFPNTEQRYALVQRLQAVDRTLDQKLNVPFIHRLKFIGPTRMFDTVYWKIQSQVASGSSVEDAFESVRGEVEKLEESLGIHPNKGSEKISL